MNILDMKTIIIAILLVFNVLMAILCHNWSIAHAELNEEYEALIDPDQHRADIYVLTNGDVYALFDGKWAYKFEGACSGLKDIRSL